MNELAAAETWFRYFQKNAKMVGLLQGSPWLQSQRPYEHQDVEGDQEKQAQLNKFHNAIDEGDVDVLNEMLGSDTRALGLLINDKCSRTSMTGLHKAVEVASLEIVKLLVETGQADLSISADLYDGDNALQLARRFRHDDIAQYLADKYNSK